MKRYVLGVVGAGMLLLSGCGIQTAQPPVYGNSGLDVTMNTARYIAPVEEKGQAVLEEATLFHDNDGSSSLTQMQTDVTQAHEVISRAKSEISAMKYPPSMADQQSQTIQSLTGLSVDIDKLMSVVKTGKDPESAYERVNMDLVQLQGMVQPEQGTNGTN